MISVTFRAAAHHPPRSSFGYCQVVYYNLPSAVFQVMAMYSRIAKCIPTLV